MTEMEPITLELDADLVEAYRAGSAQDKSKLRLLLNLWLREPFVRTTSLKSLMDELSDKAQQRGLTPEKLETLLCAG
jgi:hypothetical protein